MNPCLEVKVPCLMLSSANPVNGGRLGGFGRWRVRSMRMRIVMERGKKKMK